MAWHKEVVTIRPIAMRPTDCATRRMNASTVSIIATSGADTSSAARQGSQLQKATASGESGGGGFF